MACGWVAEACNDEKRPHPIAEQPCSMAQGEAAKMWSWRTIQMSLCDVSELPETRVRSDVRAHELAEGVAGDLEDDQPTMPPSVGQRAEDGEHAHVEDGTGKGIVAVCARRCQLRTDETCRVARTLAIKRLVDKVHEFGVAHVASIDCGRRQRKQCGRDMGRTEGHEVEKHAEGDDDTILLEDEASLCL